ncbi:CobW family GTP-binding protein [Sphingomonas sp. UYP23]
MTARSLIPVTLLTGFLGAGKTTLIARLLCDPRFSDTAVVINEFGTVGIDHLLVQHLRDDAVIEMTSGCLCCTVRGDIRQALLMLYHRAEIGELPLFSRLVIETTGLADPAPVMHTLLSDARLETRYRLAQVVTVVDAAHGFETLDAHREAVKQIAVADRLLVTKTDTPDGKAALPRLRERLESIAPGAPIVESQDADFDLRAVLQDSGGYDPDAKPSEVLEWLNAVAHEQIYVGQAHNTAGHGHDIDRHSEAIRSFCLTLDEPISQLALSYALELLASNQGPDILRVKGLVAIEDYPLRPVIIHMVQHMIHTPSRLEAWPSADRRTRIVFITRNIDPAQVAHFFARWIHTYPAKPELVE